jgi:Ca2+/H+ antiporter, TMEM165/GDT1 family
MLAPQGARLPDLPWQVGETFVSGVLSNMAGTKDILLAPGGKAGMNLAIIAAVFPVIFIGELPDKTMFASLVLSTHGRPRMVWLGAAAAFVVHVVIAVSVGVALFRFLPHRVLEGLVSVMFLVGAGLAFREARREKDGETPGPHIAPALMGRRRTAITAFTVVFVAEWGDLTQILTANLAARYHSPLSVGIGAILGLWAVAALAVASGSTLLRWVNIRTVRIVTGVVLVVIAGLTAWLALRLCGLADRCLGS